MVGFIGGPKKALSKMKKTIPALAAAQQAKKGAPASIGGKGGSVAKKPVGTANPVGDGFKPNMPMVRPDMSRVQKPVGPAKPVGALKNPIGAGGMAKMPTSAAKKIGSLGASVARSMMKKGGAVKKTAAKKGKK